MNRNDLPDRFYIQKDRTRILSVVMKELVRDVALAKAVKQKELFSLWREIVGEEIYKHTKVAGLKRGCLSVEVDSATLLHHLTNFCREEILSELQTRYKKSFITSIRFRVSTGTES